MTDELNAMKQQIVAAVQQQLTQYSEQVRSTVQSLRDEIAAERTARSRSDEQIRALATGLERSHQSNSTYQSELQRLLEERLTEFGVSTKRRHEEMNNRLDRVVDEANSGLNSAVESATRPILRDLEHRQGKVEGDVTRLDNTLRKFDEQAAKMVTHINEVTSGVDGRIEQLGQRIHADVDGRVTGLSGRVDEVSAQAARQQSDVANAIGERVDAAESRINDKIATAEARISEDVGSRIAEIDAYVGRVSVGLDEGIVMLNDRFADVNSRFDATAEQITQMHESLKDVDSEAIDEMKDRVRSIAGEAELVRIEMDRFKESMGDAMDKNAVRLTELETQMQDQALDTETAVQLERLEEVERALIALDPDQFVRVSDMKNNPGGTPPASLGTTPPGTASPGTASSPADSAGNEEEFDATFTMPSIDTPPSQGSDPIASFAPPAGS